MAKKKVLIGCCGGLTGSYLVRQFKRKDGFFVIGADADESHMTRRFADQCVLLPPVSSSDFCDCLFEVLKQEKIDYYLPTHSVEIRTVAQHEARIRREWEGKFLVSPYETFLKLEHKREANRYLRDAGIPVPCRVEDDEYSIRYPIIMKPDISSGSKRTQMVETPTLHRELAHLCPDCSFYEYVSGVEYTVDCMFDEAGKLLAYNPRVRIKNLGGAAIVTKNNYAFDVLPYLKKLEAEFLIKGCVNFQYILSDGIPYFIDVNLRYASGGLPLTVASGMDIIQMMLDIWEGRPVNWERNLHADGKTMYRYFEEWYEDEP